MNHDEDESGITKLVRGNPQEAQEVRKGLAAFARSSDDPKVRRLVSDVLAGRLDIREALRSKDLAEVAGAKLAKLEQELDRLTDEERAALLDPERAPDRRAGLTSQRAASAVDHGFDDDAEFRIWPDI